MSAIDPIRMGDGLIRKLSAGQYRQPRNDQKGQAAHYSDDPTLAIYRIRNYKDGNKWSTTTMIDILGCNEDCAHCFVPVAALRGDLNSAYVKMMLSRLPGSLKGKATHQAGDIYAEITKRMRNRSEALEGQVIELTGGEPTLYRAGLLELSRLASQDTITVAINTNGLLIGTDEKYLDAFSGFEGNVQFSVSPKGITPEEFRRFTDAKQEYFETPFVAYARILERGFKAFLSVHLDTLAFPEELEQEDNPVERLRTRIESIKPGAFSGIIWDRMRTHMFSNKYDDAEAKMVARGYWKRDAEGKIVKRTDGKKVKNYIDGQKRFSNSAL